MDKVSKLESVLKLKPGIEKKKGKLLGPVKVNFPTREEFSDLSEDQQAEFLDEASRLSESVVKCIDRIVSRPDKRDDDAVLRSIIADMGRTKGLPHRQQYVEMGLWRRIVSFSGRSRRMADDACRKIQSEGDDDEISGGGGLSFRDFYMAEITAKHAGSIEAFHESEEMDIDKAQLFVRCLEAGMDIFADAQKDLCITKKFPNNGKDADAKSS
ncbi:hypothetical protein NDN08_002245 [Rhodosorus marinus]|uniref:Ribosome assembly protein 3 n=1 Tax=Rhodosorus marinus TaxID=101924 RepID=A0AAV8UT56_9RHOD|nr:hypothetical protein NDN08_002245 [Rhodosorus marinus]